MTRRAKIVATIGPASRSPAVLEALLQAGMDVARLNFSHGKPQDHAKALANLRELSDAAGRAIMVLQDLQGPRLRTGDLPGGESVTLEPGRELELTNEPISAGSSERIQIRYPHLLEDVSPGDPILIDDGKIRLEVTDTKDRSVIARVLIGGELKADKGVNLPGVQLSTPALTEKDRSDLAFGLELGVDAVAMSFVRNAEDVKELRSAMATAVGEEQIVPIIAKLERPDAMDHLDEILSLADGVMVARGDLGVEVSPERVPSLQKKILQHANAQNVVAITATEMLDSMIHNPRPTRAEASDVANAVFDGSDALMLSGETAVGRYPVQAVGTMDRIIRDAEAHALEWGYMPELSAAACEDDALATTRAARRLSQDRDVAAIAVFTQSGRTARLMSKARPLAPIMGFTSREITFRRMALLWGVVPKHCIHVDTVEAMIETVERELLQSGAIERGQQVVLVASLPVGAMGAPNFTYLHTVG